MLQTTKITGSGRDLWTAVCLLCGETNVSTRNMNIKIDEINLCMSMLPRNERIFVS